MSGLAALLAGHTPPGVYQWHNAAHVEDVQHAVEHAGWDFRHLDGWTVEDRESFVKALSAALETSDADDLDQIGAELGQVGAGHDHGTVLLWDGWSPLARHDAATFDEALGMLRRRTGEDGAFGVILRGDGPDLDLEELPVKH